MSTTSFLQFPQDAVSMKLSYRPWLASARSSLSATGTRDYGFIGLAMSAADYIDFQATVNPAAAPAPFLLLPRPDPDFRVIFPAVAGLGAENQRTADIINLSAYNRLLAAFDKEQAHIATLTTLLSGSISPAASLAAGHPRFGFAGMPLSAIFTAMAVSFGQLTADEIADLDRSLDTKWTSGSIASHIAHHVDAHEILRANGAPISTIAKIQRLTGSLSPLQASDPTHPFHVELVNYRDGHPDLARQEFRPFAAIIERAGFAISPVPPAAISAAKKKVAATADSAHRQKSQSGNLVFCAHHGMNKSHITEHCQYLGKHGKAAGGGPK